MDLDYGFSTLVSSLVDKVALKHRNIIFTSWWIVGRRQPEICNTIVVLTLCFVLTLQSAASRAEELYYDIDIRSMNVAEALNRLADQTGATTLFPYDLVRLKTANAVVGRYKLLDALNLLLQDTGLSSGLSDKRVISISVIEHTERHNEGNAVKVRTRGKIAALVAIIFASSGTSAQQSELSDTTLEEIVVTGSHIRRDTFSATSPITLLDGEVIGKLGEVDIGSFLARTPSITSDHNAASTSKNLSRTSGLNTVALRNLGSSRTLVLVNGRRYVSGVSVGAGYGVDLNSISPSTIDRIEVLTGNQSAVYGSDAIAGVINIITKTDFDGVSLKVQASQATEGGRD